MGVSPEPARMNHPRAAHMRAFVRCVKIAPGRGLRPPAARDGEVLDRMAASANLAPDERESAGVVEGRRVDRMEAGGAGERLVGGWELVRWAILGGGRENFPFGPAASGLILYGADGWMSATIAAADRPPLSTANPRLAPAAERAAAFAGYFSYAGTWRVDGEEVIHAVRWSLNPAFVGTEQRRSGRRADPVGLRPRSGRRAETPRSRMAAEAKAG